MPDQLVEDSDEDDADSEDPNKKSSSDRSDTREGKNRKGGSGNDSASSKGPKGLSDSQRDRFENMLRNLTPDRNPVAETMVWCIEHADAWEEIVDCISESLGIMQTPLAKKVARLYLVSDILHNCGVASGVLPNVSNFRKGFQAKLPTVFAELHSYHQKIEARMKAEAFRQRVLNCFRAWEDWALYPQDFLIRLQNIFLGLVVQQGNSSKGGLVSEYGGGDDLAEEEAAGRPHQLQQQPDEDDDDDDVDGIPLDGAALLKSAAQKGLSPFRRKCIPRTLALIERFSFDDILQAKV